MALGDRVSVLAEISNMLAGFDFVSVRRTDGLCLGRATPAGTACAGPWLEVPFYRGGLVVSPLSGECGIFYQATVQLASWARLIVRAGSVQLAVTLYA